MTRFRYLFLQPGHIRGRASLDRHLQDLRELVLVAAAYELLHSLRPRLERLDEQQRLVLALQPAVPVVDRVHGGHDGAAARQMLDDDRRAQHVPAREAVADTARRDELADARPVALRERSRRRRMMEVELVEELE